MKLYVGNLPYQATEEELADFFGQKGAVSSVSIITDRATGRSKGFGFIEFGSKEDGQTAITECDGQEFGGRNLRVSEAQERSDRGPRSGGFR